MVEGSRGKKRLKRKKRQKTLGSTRGSTRERDSTASICGGGFGDRGEKGEKDPQILCETPCQDKDGQ